MFLDYQNIGSGDFEHVILENIRARAHFLVVLTPSALKKCDNPKDWLRREIGEALETQRNIVPLMIEGFDFGLPAIGSKLTGRLALLKAYNGMTVPAEHFNAAMAKLREQFLNVPLDAVLHPVSEFAQQAAREQQIAAAAAPSVRHSELTAQEWFERGFTASDPDEKMRCYTEALRLEPTLAVAYNNRGLVRADKGDLDGAVADYTEALRLKPAYAAVYNNRGRVRAIKDGFAGAVADFTEAIRLEPTYAKAYNNRGHALEAKGDMEAAQRDFDKAKLLKSQRDTLPKG